VSRPLPGIVVQARMGSTRLPGKVLLPLQGGTVLGHLIRRLKRCARAKLVVVATTELAADEAVAEEAVKLGAVAFRGSEEDLLERYAAAAEALGIDPVVRITADCPLLDPVLIDRALSRLLDGTGSRRPPDLVTNTRDGHRTYPRGLDVEVMRRSLLLEGRRRVPKGAPEREHATLWFYRHPEGLVIEDLVGEADHSVHRWTLDTPEDFELIRRVYAELHPRLPAFGMGDVLELMAAHPEIPALNAHIRQKEA